MLLRGQVRTQASVPAPGSKAAGGYKLLTLKSRILDTELSD